MQNRSRGVYFLASDGTAELARAFLNSFRKYNPDIPLCLIPFNEEFRKLENLQDQFNFSIFSDRQMIESCDEISRRFHGHVRGEYRKFCIWEGAFEEFVYIDVDTVILSDYDFVTAHSNMPEISAMVWRPSIRDAGKLSSGQIEFAANTGFVTSKLGALSMEEIKGKTEEALQLAEHMELFCKEQPLLNYLIVTSGKKYTSLFVLDYRNPEK